MPIDTTSIANNGKFHASRQRLVQGGGAYAYEAKRPWADGDVTQTAAPNLHDRFAPRVCSVASLSIWSNRSPQAEAWVPNGSSFSVADAISRSPSPARKFGPLAEDPPGSPCR